MSTGGSETRKPGYYWAKVSIDDPDDEDVILEYWGEGVWKYCDSWGVKIDAFHWIDLHPIVRAETTEGWISVKDKMPEMPDGDCSLPVLVLGFKLSRPESFEYDTCCWRVGLDGKKEWSKEWWNDNPDYYWIHYWQPLPKPPQP